MSYIVFWAVGYMKNLKCVLPLKNPQMEEMEASINGV